MWLKKEKVIFQTESLGVPIQVIDKIGRRELKFGNHVVQSAVSKASPDFLLLSYTRHMMLGLVLRSQIDHLLHIGLGAGNIPRFLHKHFSQVTQDAMEISPEVIAIAHQYFNLPQDRIHFIIGDGFESMANCQKDYDLIFLDAFIAEGTPKHLTTSEFFRLLRQRLKPGGWVVGNVWTSELDLYQQIENWQAVFDVVWKAPVPVMGNVILFGGNASPAFDKLALKQKARALQQKIPLKFLDFLQYLEPIDATYSP